MRFTSLTIYNFYNCSIEQQKVVFNLALIWMSDHLILHSWNQIPQGDERFTEDCWLCYDLVCKKVGCCRLGSEPVLNSSNGLNWPETMEDHLLKQEVLDCV